MLTAKKTNQITSRNQSIAINVSILIQITYNEIIIMMIGFDITNDLMEENKIS